MTEIESLQLRVRPFAYVAAVSAAVAILLFLTVGIAAQIINFAFGLWFSQILIFLGTAWVVLRHSGRNPLHDTGLSAFSWSTVAFGFALGAANYFAVAIPIQVVAESLAPKWMVKMYDARYLFENQTPAELALIVAGVTLAAPLCEEFFFRGVVQKGFLSVFRKGTALVVTAAFFSAFHLDPVGFVARLELGLLFGLLAVRSGSLWPSIGAHSANNAVSTVVYFLAEHPAETKTPPHWHEVFSVAAPAAVVLMLLLLWAQRQPSLLTPPRPEPKESLPWSLSRAVWPWMAGALAASLAYVGVDYRGAQLSLHDMAIQLPKDAVPKEAREELERIRAEARRGEISMETYVERRKALQNTCSAAP